MIIDGVDVSECEFYFDEKCRCMDASIMQDFYSCPQCNSNPNCYYKQLQRKEQECERLSKYSVGFAKKCQRLELDILHLKDENNRFKREIQPFNDDYFKDLDTKTIAELEKKSIRLTTENRKLENALDEIEEYINTQLDELAVKKIKDIINGAKDIKVPHKAKE